MGVGVGVGKMEECEREREMGDGRRETKRCEEMRRDAEGCEKKDAEG